MILKSKRQVGNEPSQVEGNYDKRNRNLIVKIHVRIHWIILRFLYTYIESQVEVGITYSIYLVDLNTQFAWN